MTANVQSTRPAITSVKAGAAPRYGTWVRSTLARYLNSSPLICGELPCPGEAKVTLPGFVLANAIFGYSPEIVKSIAAPGQILMYVGGAALVAIVFFAIGWVAASPAALMYIV